jgi:asparagine synthase (glutamine-hydrolysing)
MSGIAGIYNLDGRPADRTRLQRMADAMAHRGPDGLSCWLHGPVGLAHAMLHTTPESLRETQPLQDDAGALRLILDGRVDNRGELRAALQSKGLPPRSDTDAELVLRAYACWGEDCPRHILGDFAFALWDETTRTLFCARDALGIKPFYYYAGQHAFVFGSELRQLFEGADIAREPNEGMIGEYLANAITSREETLYRGILRLPPAHWLRVQQGKLQLRRYWDIDPARAIRYRTDAQYAEHFMEIFAEAVRCRLRSQGGVGAELSGGLDSSSVVCMVQSLVRTGAAEGADVETFSLAFPGLPCDESAYIEEVVRKSGARSKVLPPHAPGPSCHEAYVRRHLDFPGYPGNYMWDSIRHALSDKGYRVLLTGLGGDDWLAGADFYYVELLRRLKFRDLLGRARRDATENGIGGAAADFYLELREDLLPLLPPAMLQAVRTALGRAGVPAWIRPQFARRGRLRERLEKKPDRHRFENRAQRDHYRLLNSGYLVHSFEYDDRPAAGAGFEMRHPFHDRRMVEFALALPPDQLWREAQSKFVLRQAMRGILPERVRQRQTKADFSHSVASAFQALGGEALFDTLAPEMADRVDAAQLRTICRRMMRLYAQGDEAYSDNIWPPWMAFGVALLYKTIFRIRIAQPNPGSHA